MRFDEFLRRRLEVADGFSTEDALASFLPLARDVLDSHLREQVAPLQGTQFLRVESGKIWFEQSHCKPMQSKLGELSRYQSQQPRAVNVVAQHRRLTDVDDGLDEYTDLAIGDDDRPIERPIYIRGYVCWEHLVGHHDPLTDVYVLGLILASLSCGLDLSVPESLRSFVYHRENLFAVNSQLHPVLARAIVRMTELNRHQRPMDLNALIVTLENYREQPIDLDFDLARIQGFQDRDERSKQFVVLTRLRERLFELSRRNRLLHFRPTMQTVNLTQASVPLSFDYQNIRPEQLLTWNDRFAKALLSDGPVSLNKYLDFTETIYLPSVLTRIMADTRRDQAEFGFAQLRLAVCFLNWANLKEKPVEHFRSPLVLLPVELKKKKGIRDTYLLQCLSSEAEVNPVIRHQFKQLYAIDLPETLDLTTTTLDDFHEYLSAAIRAGEAAVSLEKIARPRISLIYERARRKLDQYRRRARLSGRGVRSFGDLDYSYDPANYHPLGVKLFTARVRPPTSHLRDVVESKPRPRSFMVPSDAPDSVREQTFYHLEQQEEENPYNWSFDLCSVTLANFKYRKMSLVRDYDVLLDEMPENPAFDSTFSLQPKPLQQDSQTAPPLSERYDVVPCDPTQAAAIGEARAGASYIIQGPPGTGKSQTITNLIADFVARGQRVLFVCEKRAAIDVVYARLKKCGLGNLCCLIHDSQADKREFVMGLKQTYEEFLEGVGSPQRGGDDEQADGGSPAPSPGSASSNHSARNAVLFDLEQELMPLSQFEAAMRRELASGLTVRDLIQRCLALADQLPQLDALQRERLPAYSAWHQHSRQIARFRSSLREFRTDGIFAGHPLRILDPRLVDVDRPLELVLTTVEAVQQHLLDLRSSLESAAIDQQFWKSVSATERLAEYAQLIAPIARSDQLRLLDFDSPRANEFEGRVRELRRGMSRRQSAGEKTVHWREKIPAADIDSALQQATALQGSFFRWLSPSWWRLRGILKRSYDFSQHVIGPTWVHLLTELRDEYESQDDYQRLADELKDDYSIRGEATAFIDRVSMVAEAGEGWTKDVATLHQQLVSPSGKSQSVEHLVSAGRSLGDLTRELDRIADAYRDCSLDELDAVLREAVAAADDLYDVLSCLGEIRELPADLSGALRHTMMTTDELEAAVADESLRRFYRDDRTTFRFNARVKERHASRIETLYDDWLTANASEVCEGVRRRFQENMAVAQSPAAKLNDDEKQFKKSYSRGRRELEHEFGKTMRYKSIRDLVSGDSGIVVRDLKPVWLMSPLSVSDTLPLDTDQVDVVIFDEASQITLEGAVPSIFRAEQVIVVGDEMQLPPTNFFASKRSEEDEELLVEEDGEVVEYDLESNSLLNHAGRNLRSTMLGWHYRSRSESLISFSNWTFYDGRLLTVPEEELPARGETPIVVEQASDARQFADAIQRRPVSFHFLPNGVYERRRNRAEADYIAHLVRELLRPEEPMSLGIVAFSEAQQGEILDALERLAKEDAEFRGRLELEWEREDDGQFVGLLVKNLENIQGDERDIVIMSVCYGHSPQGKMLMNFGPINMSGGEKRLNVAFSRAKHKMALVCSIQHHEITNDYNDGANCLKNYLRYVEAMSVGDLDSGHAVLQATSRGNRAEPGRQSDEPLLEQMAEALRSQGWLVELGIGQSSFRCDLAVRGPQDDRYRLGIMVDGDDYYAQSDLLEREMMRPRLLRAFGWRITHVYAKDWYADRDAVFQHLTELLSPQE